jgi:hypothetical protein
VQFLKYTSYVLTVAGFVVAGAGWILELSPVFILIGVLLAWAGVVKIAVVAIWTKVAKLGTEHHQPIAEQ